MVLILFLHIENNYLSADKTIIIIYHPHCSYRKQLVI
jgi:hypothetical protein